MRQNVLKLIVLSLAIIGHGAVVSVACAQNKPAAVGNALRGLFNPGAAVEANTMGLLQRSNFIDRVAASRGRIEIALVVDATESMHEQLQGIQQQLLSMIDDVRRVAGDEVYLQIVLFRDSSAPSGAVELPLGNQAFTRDRQAIDDGLKKLVPQSGAPYFHEAVDQGIHAALNELSWSKDERSTRWLFVVGDAPPFDRGFHEPETGAERKYSTEQLIQRAQQLGIEINAIVCPTRSKDEAIYTEVLGLTRYFFSELTSQTGGWMLDLSDPQLLETITTAAQGAVSEFIEIEPITFSELDELRATAQAQAAPIAPLGRVRVAVLPFLTIEKMNFSRRNPAVRFADEMRSQLETVGLAVEVASNFEIERTFYKLNVKGMSREAVLQQVGRGVNADFVICGEFESGPPSKVFSTILDTNTGKSVVTIPGGIETQFPLRANFCSTVLDALAQGSRQAGNPLQLARVDRKFKTRLVANTEQVERLTLAARGRIADALQLELGQGISQELWSEAQADLESAVKLEPNNPLVNALLANVYFAQFQLLQASNDAAGAAAKRRVANQLIGVAKKNMGSVFASDQLEIDADFNFYRGNFAQAAAIYEQLLERGETLAHVERARWMLTGIYSGDWGIDASAGELVDARKARTQIVQLLAFFQESPHAKLLEKHLLWDDARGGTLSNSLPLTHVDVVSGTK